MNEPSIDKSIQAPRISIIIATFKAGKYLDECLRSCISQTWQNKEIIVIDGGSHDDTVDIIRRYQTNLAYWITEGDQGIYDAWNKALPHVTGNWVLFRGADDLFWDKDSLKKAAAGLGAALPSELFCYGSVVHVDEDKQVVDIKGDPWLIAKQTFLKQMSIPHTTTFHHVDLFRRFGSFNPSYKIAGDYDFLLRAVVCGNVEGRFLPGVIVTRMSIGGISRNSGLLTKRETISVLRKNGASYFPLLQYCEIAKILFFGWRRSVLRFILGEARMRKLRFQRRNSRTAEVNETIASVLGGS